MRARRAGGAQRRQRGRLPDLRDTRIKVGELEILVASERVRHRLEELCVGSPLLGRHLLFQPFRKGVGQDHADDFTRVGAGIEPGEHPAVGVLDEDVRSGHHCRLEQRVQIVHRLERRSGIDTGSLRLGCKAPSITVVVPGQW